MKKWAKESYKRLLFNLSAHNNFLFLGYYRLLHRPKSGSLDSFLDQFSKSKRPCTVLQIGANDGITHDPIHKYIKRDHWRGVLLEPQKQVYQKHLSKIYALDSDIHTVNAAVGPVDGVQAIYKIGFSQARWATGLTSFRREVLEQAFSSGHVARQAAKEGIAIPKDPTTWIVEESVQVLSVNSILTKYNLTHIDLLQIDTEGYDFEVIKFFDFSQLSPAVIIYENTHLSQQDSAACEQFLRSKSYRLKQFNGNTLAMQQPEGRFLAFFE